VGSRGRPGGLLPARGGAGTGAALEWRTSAGLGTVYSTTTVHPRGEAPHNVALIDLDEGFRMLSRVEGVAPGAVAIGMRVAVAFAGPAGEDPPLPVFGPVEP
jgi:uncharacterized OB-fold protein